MLLRVDRTLTKLLEFEHGVARRSASNVAEHPWGFGLLLRDCPLSLEHNRVVVTRATDPNLVRQVAESSLHDPQRIAISWDEPGGTSHVRELRSAGYEARTESLLAWGGADLPDVSPAGVAEVVAPGVTDPFVTASWERAGMTHETATELTSRRTIKERAVEVAYLAVRRRGEVVAQCEVYTDRNVAQIDALLTHPQWQRHGFASALLQLAVARATAAGCSAIFLRTDADDWPRHFYRRRGFRDVAVLAAFER